MSAQKVLFALLKSENYGKMLDLERKVKKKYTFF